MVKLVVQTILSRDKYSLSSVAERGASMMVILSWDVVAAGEALPKSGEPRSARAGIWPLTLASLLTCAIALPSFFTCLVVLQRGFSSGQFL